MPQWIGLILLLVLLWWIAVMLFSRVQVLEYQCGLLYKKGKYKGTLKAGSYFFLKPVTRVHIYDLRSRALILPGQEVLTSDNVQLKISLAGFYRYQDVAKAEHGSENIYVEIYNRAQMALREVIGQKPFEEVMGEKQAVSEAVHEKLKQEAAQIGLELTQLAVRDIMLPPGLKKAYLGLEQAKKEAQVNMEKARGEQALLRSLANAAKQYASHPYLSQARMLQLLANESGHTIVFGDMAEGKVTVKEKAG